MSTYKSKTTPQHVKLVEIWVCYNPNYGDRRTAFYASIVECVRLPPTPKSKKGNYTEWQFQGSSLLEGGSMANTARMVESFMLKQYQEHGVKAVKLRIEWRVV